MEPRDILEMLISSPDGAYAVDMDQRVFLWNASAERVLGWKADEVLGKLCYQVLGGPATVRADATPCARNCAPIQQARRGSVAPAQRLLAFTRAGAPRWISVTHVLVPSVKRDAGALVHLFHDVTHQVNHGGTIQQVAEAASETNHAHASGADSEEPAAEELTAREKEILQLMRQGLGTQVVAERLVIAVPTVRNHVQRILAKLGVHTRLEAVALASRKALLD